jgi:hypothetical protein
MIPVEQIAPGAIQSLAEYLRNEINQALGERRPLEEKWLRWIRAYKAESSEEIKKFPFHGAANLVIPVVATDVDVIYSRIMGILFAPDNFASCRARSPEMVEFARVLQEFLQAVQFRELNLFNAAADFVLELSKLGTGVLKSRYRRESKNVYEFRETPDGIQEAVQQLYIKDNPEVNHVSLFDFLVPSIAQDIQSAPWCAERIQLTPQQYLNRVREGVYLPVPALMNYGQASEPNSFETLFQELDGFKTGRSDRITLWECWLDYAITPEGDPRAIVCTIHLPTFSIVRLDWNPYLTQRRPYAAARFMRQEKRFYGIGMGEMLEPFQDEVSAMHNQRIDSGTLANSFMFKGRSGVVREDEPVFPGRWFILDDMNDVQTLEMNSGKYDSSVQYEPITMDYAKRRSGVNEHVAGQFAPSIGYATAHTNIQQLQQATQRFDQTLREIRDAFGEMITLCVEMYQQFDRGGREYEILGERDGTIMNLFIQFPSSLIRDGVAIEVTATSASANKELEIRTNTILMQMVNQFYRETLDGLMLLFTPGLPPQLQAIILQMVQGGAILMRRILEAHGVQDTDDLVPHIQGLISGNLPIGQLISERALLAGGGGNSPFGALGGIGPGGAPAGNPAAGPPAQAGSGGFMGGGMQAPGGDLPM